MRTRIIRTEAGNAAGAASAADAMRMVLLPGAYHEPDDFLQAGFEQALRERGMRAELILAAPQRSHLTDRAWIGQLRAEVIEPARARGGAPLWLGGVSLGAFMALRYAAEHHSGIDGLCLLAPYLGSRIVAAEVAAASTLESWQPGVPADDDDERRIWQYIRGLREESAAPRIFLGFGSEDRFADTQRLLQRCLPGAASCVVPGTHDWPVWRHLWDNFLDLHGGRAEGPWT